MNAVVQNIINGTMMGCIYALIALGLSIIFGVMNIVNFAHGEFVMVSMYFTFWVGSLFTIDAVVTPVITFPLLFFFGLLTYHLIIDRTLRQKYVTQIAVTVGLMTLLRAVAQLVWKARPRALPYSIIQGNIVIGGYTIMLSRLISALVSIASIFMIYLFLTRTWQGRAIRAASDDLDAASLMGINYKWTYALAFGLGTALTAIAGGMLMSFQQVDPTMGLRFGLLSFCILALAGLGSTLGLLISGLIVGIAESLAVGLWDPRARSLVVYLIFVLVLWLRPRGLFGGK
ncbi:High-affinity branched-chain amino acid transport system permease protein LivH [subsurface metagenome]